VLSADCDLSCNIGLSQTHSKTDGWKPRAYFGIAVWRGPFGVIIVNHQHSPSCEFSKLFFGMSILLSIPQLVSVSIQCTRASFDYSCFVGSAKATLKAPRGKGNERFAKGYWRSSFCPCIQLVVATDYLRHGLHMPRPRGPNRDSLGVKPMTFAQSMCQMQAPGVDPAMVWTRVDGEAFGRLTKLRCCREKPYPVARQDEGTVSRTSERFDCPRSLASQNYGAKTMARPPESADKDGRSPAPFAGIFRGPGHVTRPRPEFSGLRCPWSFILAVQSLVVHAEESSPLARSFMTEKKPPGSGTEAGRYDKGALREDQSYAAGADAVDWINQSR